MAEEAEVLTQDTGTSPEAESANKDVPANQETASGEQETKPEKTLTQAEVDEIVQKRLAKERRKLEREIRLETENEYLKRGTQKEEPQAQTGKPATEQFGTYEEYLEALAKYTVTEERKKAQQEDEAKKAHETTKQKVATYAERADKARETLADFDDVVDQDLPISQAMVESITDSEIGPQIAYYLGKNPQEALRIAKLPPMAAAREIGKLEAKLTPADEPEKTETTPSKAPKPPSPVKGATTSPGPSDNDSMDDWLRKRNKQLRRA